MRCTTRWGPALGVLLALLSGCASDRQPDPKTFGDSQLPAREIPTIPAGSSGQTIEVDDTPRAFRVYRPVRLPNPAPLVVMLHGGYGSGEQAENSYGWNSLAETAGFLVAYPDGRDRAWNTGGGCCGQPARDNVDDVAFISAVVAAIGRAVPVDANRVYAAGISNGGIMAYTLACHTTLFAAIGPDAATQLGGCSHPAPTSVIHIHGTADRSIPYNGGPGTGIAHINGPSAAALNATWRDINQCAPPTSTTDGPVKATVATCPAGRTVELITVEGAGHQWPGAASKPLAERVLHTDPPSTALNATQTIWRFFARHSRSS